MLSSAFFFLAAKTIFYLRAFSYLFQKDQRDSQKKRLLSYLGTFKKLAFGEIAKNAVHTTDRILSAVAGNKICSLSYLFRLVAMGFGFGLFFSCFALMFVSANFEQALRIAQNNPWRQLVLFPSLIVGSLLCPLDVTVAHLLVRWAGKGGLGRSAIALFVAFPLGYFLWAVGAGLAASFGLYFSNDFFMASFVSNRIWVAFRDPITSSATMSIGTHSFSYGLLSATSALSSFLVSIIFFSSVILRSVSPRIQNILVAPIFAVLAVLDWLEKKNVDYPIKIIAWISAGLLLLCAITLRFIGD